MNYPVRAAARKWYTNWRTALIFLLTDKGQQVGRKLILIGKK